jgi:hypothetical protein
LIFVEANFIQKRYQELVEKMISDNSSEEESNDGGDLNQLDFRQWEERQRLRNRQQRKQQQLDKARNDDDEIYQPPSKSRKAKSLRMQILFTLLVFVGISLGLVYLFRKARITAEERHPEPYIDPALITQDIKDAQDWLRESFELFIRDIPPDEETTKLNVGAVAVLFDVHEVMVVESDKRIPNGLQFLRETFEYTQARRDVATFINDLGAYFSVIWRDEKEMTQSLYLEESLAMLNEALELRKSFFKTEKHPDIAQTYLNIAVVLETNNHNRDLAKELGRKGYEILKETLGEQHKRTIDAKKDWIDQNS